MNPRALEKIKRELALARRSPQTARALQSFARQLGRKEVKRGKEHVWENLELSDVYPLAIPKHGNRDLAPGTKNNILDSLEGDVVAWEVRFSDEHDQEKIEDGASDEG